MALLCDNYRHFCKEYSCTGENTKIAIETSTISAPCSISIKNHKFAAAIVRFSKAHPTLINSSLSSGSTTGNRLEKSGYNRMVFWLIENFKGWVLHYDHNPRLLSGKSWRWHINV